MSHRNLGKVVVIASVVLLLAVSTAALAVLFLSPRAPDDVEVSGTAHSGDAPDRSERRGSGDAHRQSRRYKTGETTPPATEQVSLPSTQEGPSTSETAAPPTSEGGGGNSGGTPGSTTTCPLPAYPSASCTGVPADTNLSIHNGDLAVGTANSVIDSRDIRGCVTINAPGVVIRRSKITCSGSAVRSHADAYSGAGVVLEDVEISCRSTKGATGVGDYNATVRRANIHSCENGFDMDGRITVEHSFIHDLIQYNPATDPHTDGSQITPVGRDIRIVHNTIYVGNGTSAIISPNVSSGVVSNVLIQDNLMAGGSYTLYCQQDGPGHNYRVINNHFSTSQFPTVGAFGPWLECADEAQVSGNLYHETGRPVPL
jgi:hypothetical protein